MGSPSKSHSFSNSFFGFFFGTGFFAVLILATLTPNMLRLLLFFAAARLYEVVAAAAVASRLYASDEIATSGNYN